MESITSMLGIWLLLAIAIVVYVAYRLLADYRSPNPKRHPLYPLVSAKGDPLFPPKGDYFTWILYSAWALALLALGVCATLQAVGRTTPEFLNVAVSALLLTAIGLLGLRLIWRNWDTKK